MRCRSVGFVLATVLLLGLVSQTFAFSARVADVDTSLEFEEWDGTDMAGRPGDSGTFLFNYSYAGNDSRFIEVTPEFSDSIEWTTPSATAGPFNSTNGSGALELGFLVREGALPGATSVSVRVGVFNATRNETTGELDLREIESSTLSANVDLEGAPATLPSPGFPPSNLSLVLGAGLIAAVVGAYLLLRPRKRAYTPRSKALRETTEATKGPRRLEPPVGPPAASQEVKAHKEILILEAKRDDLVGQVEVARGRMERGEINEFVFNNLKKKKEEALAEVEAGLERLHDESEGRDPRHR